MFDLGARYDLCEVILNWEVAVGKDFQIQISEDAVNWTTIKAITGNKSLENYLPLQGSGRYVRMYGTARELLMVIHYGNLKFMENRVL